MKTGSGYRLLPYFFYMNPSNIIYNTARNAGFPDILARLLVAQAQHETGNFTSNFFKKYNNAFGYSYVSGAKWQLRDPGTIADNGAPIAAYASLENSTMEVVDWIKRRIAQGVFPAAELINGPALYAELLKKAGYYQDKVENYSRALVKFFTAGMDAVDLSSTDKMLVTTFIIAGVLYYIYRDK